MPDARTPLLSVKDLQAWYGESHILHGVNFDVYHGEVVTLLGRNGAGKTTTMKSIMGIVGNRKGSVRYEGQELVGLPSNAIARARDRADKNQRAVRMLRRNCCSTRLAIAPHTGLRWATQSKSTPGLTRHSPSSAGVYWGYSCRYFSVF